jgi:hypothetical protein
MIELAIAISIVVLAILPLGYSWMSDQKLARVYYYRAVAMEIVDGELEVLAAGAWRTLPEGTRAYTPRAGAVKSLPPGKFVFSRTAGKLRLEWAPDGKNGGGKIVREGRGE